VDQAVRRPLAGDGWSTANGGSGKDGGRFDSVAGATVTPRAVIKAVHKALRYVAENRRQLFLMPIRCQAQEEKDDQSRRIPPDQSQRCLAPEHQPGADPRPLSAAGGDHQSGQWRDAVAGDDPRHGIANVAVASLRNLIPHEIRIPVFILIVAALVTVVDLLFNAKLHELYLVLGIFIPLIVTNCIVLARVEAFANKNPPLQSMLRRRFHGRRHVVDAGPARRSARTDRRRHAVFRDRHGFSGLQPLQLLPADYPGFLLAMLPPGAFILLGCLIAWKNWVEARAAARKTGSAALAAGLAADGA
jgi:electron transport complex protein RnfE